MSLRPIRASELQTFGYCARCWWLQHILGLEPADRERMVAGTERHRAYGEGVVQAGRLARVATWLLFLALFLGGLALFLLWRGG